MKPLYFVFTALLLTSSFLPLDVLPVAHASKPIYSWPISNAQSHEDTNCTASWTGIGNANTGGVTTYEVQDPTWIGQTINSFTFYLSNTGTGMNGTLVVGIFDFYSGSLVHLMGTIDIKTIVSCSSAPFPAPDRFNITDSSPVELGVGQGIGYSSNAPYTGGNNTANYVDYRSDCTACPSGFPNLQEHEYKMSTHRVVASNAPVALFGEIDGTSAGPASPISAATGSIGNIFSFIFVAVGAVLLMEDFQQTKMRTRPGMLRAGLAAAVVAMGAIMIAGIFLHL